MGAHLAVGAERQQTARHLEVVRREHLPRGHLVAWPRHGMEEWAARARLGREPLRRGVSVRDETRRLESIDGVRWEARLLRALAAHALVNGDARRLRAQPPVDARARVARVLARACPPATIWSSIPAYVGLLIDRVATHTPHGRLELGLAGSRTYRCGGRDGGASVAPISRRSRVHLSRTHPLTCTPNEGMPK